MNALLQPVRIPSSMEPDDIGPYLRELREHFKLSVQDVSERLHIRARYVTAIEEGRFDALPGAVYARGYVHTYAEFLGLDADRVVEQCFKVKAPEPAPLQVGQKQAREAKPALKQTLVSQWRNIAILAVIGMVMLVILVQLIGMVRLQGSVMPPTTPAVPEKMLASIRDEVFPTEPNYNCLMGNYHLSCFFATSQIAMEANGGIWVRVPFMPVIDSHDSAMIATDDMDDPAVEEGSDSPPPTPRQRRVTPPATAVTPKLPAEPSTAPVSVPAPEPETEAVHD